MSPNADANFFTRFGPSSETHGEHWHLEDPFLSISKAECEFVP